MKKNVVIVIMALAMLAFGVASASAGFWVEKATGGGVCDLPGKGKTIFAFAAQEDHKGRVFGQALFNFPECPTCGKFHVKVKCLRVVGNVAWMVGIITKAELPNLVGLTLGWEVMDTGHRCKPDKISHFWWPDPESPCEDWPDLCLYELTCGNIHVEEGRCK